MRHMITDKDMSNPHEFIQVMQDPIHSQSDDSERCYHNNHNNNNNIEEADSVYGTLECEDEDNDYDDDRHRNLPTVSCIFYIFLHFICIAFLIIFQ